ncbi:hypothetical protein V1506DRAFT_361887 [Lipomyces tetrasporus]
MHGAMNGPTRLAFLFYLSFRSVCTFAKQGWCDITLLRTYRQQGRVCTTRACHVVFAISHNFQFCYLVMAS